MTAKHPTITTLVEQARTAAELFDECDKALMELNGSFGAPYEAARQNLTNDLVCVDSRNTVDLSVFQGPESLFKFPEFKTNIIVRVSTIPSPHSTLDKIEDKIEKLEQQLKLAKAERKALVERLKIQGKVDLLTDKITTAFTRIK